jgi:hypothetical protein
MKFLDFFKYIIGDEDGIFGLFGGDDPAPQFNPNTAELESDVAKVRKLRDSEITGPRKSAQIIQEQIQKDRSRAFGDIAAGGQGRFAAMQGALARTGGLSGGASERLAVQSSRDQALNNQRTSADFGRLNSGVLAQDIGQQEAFKNQALFKTPQLSAIPLEIQTQAQAANMRAKALQEESNSQGLGAFGSLLGAGVGAFASNPVLGAQIGGGLFSSMR